METGKWRDAATAECCVFLSSVLLLQFVKLKLQGEVGEVSNKLPQSRGDTQINAAFLARSLLRVSDFSREEE